MVAIHGFSGHFCVFGREKNKRELKREWKMMWKIVTMNTLGSEIKKNEAKMHFSCQAHTAKKVKIDHFSITFCKSKVRVPFCIQFLIIFNSFSVSILSKMEWKWNGKWWENEWKMNQKCQLWTTLLYWSSPTI